MSEECPFHLKTVSKMEPLEYHSVITFLNMQGNSPSVIFEEIFSVYQEECPSYKTVKYWVRKFKSGFLSIHDSPQEGRPNFVVTEDSVSQVKTLVLEDRRVTVKQLAAITKMSVGSIETIQIFCMIIFTCLRYRLGGYRDF